jgi:hypothetical protein
MADKKITQLTNITGANLVDADEFVVVDISVDETKSITLAELKTAFDSGSGFVRITGDTMSGDLTVPNLVVSGTVDGVDIAARDAILTSTTTTANAALPKAGGTMTGALDVGGTVTADGLTVQNANDVTTNTAEFRNDNGNRTFRFAQNTSGDADLLLEKNDGTDTVLISTHGDSYFNGGNVGIGTDSPTQALVVSESSTPTIQLKDGAASGTRVSGRLHIGESDTLGVSIENSTSSYNDNCAMVFKTSPAAGTITERMRIANNGNVGIGTDSPDKPLEVFATNTAMKISGTGVSSTGLLFETNGVERKKIGIPSGSSDLAFYSDAGSSEAMRIDSSGNLLVGTTSTSTPTGGLAFRNSSNIGNFSIGHASGTGSGNNYGSFKYNGTSIGSIAQSGTTGVSYNTSSDYRLKTDAQPMTGASDRVLALNPVNFEWISDGTRVDGFLAHEAQAVVPECVTGTKDALRDEEYQVSAATGDIYTPATDAYVDEDGNYVDAVDEVIHSADAEQPETLEDGQQWRETTAAVMGTRSVPDMQGIDQSKMVPLLVAALQEALARITALENA